MSECKHCGVRLGDGSTSDACPSCEETYSLVRVKRKWVPEWLWKTGCWLWVMMRLHWPCNWLSVEVKP